jgi:hypothetical protein
MEDKHGQGFFNSFKYDVHGEFCHHRNYNCAAVSKKSPEDYILYFMGGGGIQAYIPVFNREYI